MLLQQALHLAHHHLLDLGRELHRLEFILDPQLQPRILLVEVGFAPRTGLGAQRFFRLFQLLAQFGELPGKTQQALALGFVSLRTLLFVRLCFVVFLKDVAQVGLCGLDLLADPDDVVEHDGRFEDLFLDFLFSGLNPLGDLDFPFPGQELKLSHLFQIQADRVGGLAEVIDALFLGFFLGVGFGLRSVFSPGTSSRTLMSMPSKLSSAALRSPGKATSPGRKSFTWSKVR